MKTKIFNLIAVVLVSIVLLQISGCGGNTTPTLSASDAVKAKLTAATSWKMQSATVDGVDQTATYKGLALAFTATAYTSTNGGVVWPTSGTWSFNSTDGTSLKRNDGLVIALDVTDTTLKLSFTWATTTLSGGKVDSVKGQTVLNFTK